MARADVWKKLLEKSRQLKGQSGTLLYKRVTMLRQVYEDEAFVSACRADGKDPLKELSVETDDTPWGFDVLLVLLRQFPREADWGTLSLREMYGRAMQAAVPRTEKKATEDGRERLSWKDRYYELQARFDQLQAENKALRKEVRDLKEVLKDRTRHSPKRQPQGTET